MHRYKPCNAKGNSKKRVHTKKCLSENHSTEVLARKHVFFASPLSFSVTPIFLESPEYSRIVFMIITLFTASM